MTADRAPAPPLSPDEEVTVARFEAAPDLPESYACTCGHEGLTAMWHADGCGTPDAREGLVERAVTAGVEAAEEMAADWYCPKARWRSRRECPGCIAEVAVRAALSAVHDRDGQRPTCGNLSPAISLGDGRYTDRLMCDLPHGHGGAHQHDNGDGLPPTRWIHDDRDGQR